MDALVSRASVCYRRISLKCYCGTIPSGSE